MILMKNPMERTVQEKVILVPECWWDAWYDALCWLQKNTNYKVIWIDCRNVLSMHTCDIFYRVSYSLSSSFEDEVMLIIREEWVTHILPTFEHWIALWEKIITQTRVICMMNTNHALLFKDKYETYLFCKKQWISTIETALLKTLPEEWWFSHKQSLYIKPRDWSWSKNNFSVTDSHQLQLLTPYLLATYWLENFIIQPFTQWTYWSVDICCTKKEHSIGLKKVTIMNWSKLVSVVFENNKKITSFIEKLIRKFVLEWIYNIELIVLDSGSIVLLEINTRLAWWSIYSVEAWMNLYEYCISGIIPNRPKNTLWYFKHGIVQSIPKIRWVKARIENPQWDFLLTKRQDVPFWTLPGWRIEAGENTHDACIRELCEEVWYTTKELQEQWVIFQYWKNNKCYALYSWVYDWSPLRKQDNEVKELWFFALDSLPYPVDSITLSLLWKKSLPYYKNSYVDYLSEYKLLMRKPIKAMMIFMKLIINMLTSSTFKI